MRDIYCNHCGNTVSAEDQQCPHCGIPLPKHEPDAIRKRFLFWFIVLIIFSATLMWLLPQFD